MSGTNDIILIATNFGIFRSGDGGSTITNVYSYCTGCSYYGSVSTIVKTSIGWLAYDRINRMLLISTNIGATWTVSTSTFVSVTANQAGRTTFSVAVPGDAVVYAVAANAVTNHILDVYRSADGGATWTALACNANGVPTNPKVGLQTDLDVMGNQAW